MHTNRAMITAMLLTGFLAGPVIARCAIADEASLKQPGQRYSPNARASVSATIASRPRVTCERVLRGVTVRVSPIPPVAGHWDPVVLPQYSCSYLDHILNLAVEMESAGAVSAGSSGHVLVVPAGTDSTINSDDAAAAGRRYIIEIIYNFE